MSRFSHTFLKLPSLLGALTLLLGVGVSAGGQEPASTTGAPETPLPKEGTRVRLWISSQPVSPLSASRRTGPPAGQGVRTNAQVMRTLRKHIGTLVAVTADSIVMTEAGSGRRIAIRRTHLAQFDSSAGRKSRVLRSLLGAPIGFATGAVLCSPGGSWGAAGCAILGVPIGVVTGAFYGGERWRRVRLPASNRSA